MFALVRTDPAAKRQQGISFLLIDMRSPGITVRPITTIDGLHTVNEVFLDDVRVPIENRVGEENRGWDYAKFLLGSERVSIAHLGLCKRRLERVRKVAVEQRRGDGVLWDDPDFRREVIAAEVALKALEITQFRVLAQQNAGSTQLDPKTSLLKIKGSELQQRATQLLLDAAGPAGVGSAGDSDDWLAAVAPAYFGNRKVSIFGGSNEIQRTILAKSVLGL
jgi:alkylation response protein AidB-like acyl-CoA dehydrogenase